MILVLAGAGSNWPPEWLPGPVRLVRIVSLSWSPVKNRTVDLLLTMHADFV